MSSTSQPEISICVLAGHGLENLETCLASLAAQDSPPSFEVLIGGKLSAALASVVQRYFPGAQLRDTEGRLPGAARNLLIERARGDLLLFLDDDVKAPASLLRTLADTAAHHPKASVFGGPNDTPPDSSRFQVVQGAVLSSLFGSGPVCRRYGARHPGLADERWFTLCNLAVRREVMLPFRTELVCAEENEVLAKLHMQGEPMLYEPRLRVFHARRSTWPDFGRQMFKYGRGRGQLIARHPRTVRAAYLAPAAFVAYVLLLPALHALSGAASFSLIPLAAYCALAVASSLWIGWTLRSATSMPLALLLVGSVHLCYGAGVLRGLLRILRSSQRLQSEPAPPAGWREPGLEPSEEGVTRS